MAYQEFYVILRNSSIISEPIALHIILSEKFSILKCFLSIARIGLVNNLIKHDDYSNLIRFNFKYVKSENQLLIFYSFLLYKKNAFMPK